MPAAAAPSVAAVADRYVEEMAALSPIDATFLGIPGHEDELGDLSPDGLAASEDLVRHTLAALAAATPDERDRVARSVMQERLGLELERLEAGLPYGDVNVLASAPQAVRMVFDLMASGTEEERGNIRARMEALPTALGGLADTYREGVRRGVLPARRQVEEVAGQCRRWAGLEGSTGFFSALVGRIPGGDALAGSAATAEAAYGDLARFLSEELAPLARAEDPVGAARYRLESRTFTGAALDLEETYAWGWEELARIEDEKTAEARAIVGTGSVPDAVAALDADPARSLSGRDALRSWMQDLSDRAVTGLNGTHFDIPEPIRALRCAIAPPGGNSGAYYTGPSEDLARPGTMWWSPAPGQDEFSTWREVTTVYHEGVPGHHLQVAQAVVNGANLTRFQRVACFVSGHGEGWALYAERLMDELGYLADPGDRLGMLDAQSLRAARVVLDIGAHLGLPIPANGFGWREGERWTVAAMQELLGARTLLDRAHVVDEVNRYLGWPGQAISYKVGERVWLQARDDARRRADGRFDVKAFHAAALDLGPMGLDLLREELGRLG